MKKKTLQQKQINSASSWLNRHGGGIVEALKNHEKRIIILERSLRPKGKRYSPPEICDAPQCNKKTQFQSGENMLGQIGSWCSKKHLKQYAKR